MVYFLKRQQPLTKKVKPVLLNKKQYMYNMCDDTIESLKDIKKYTEV